MQISTTRFGSVRIEADDILLFPNGLVGFEHARHWVLLADGENDWVGWLQSISQAELAMPVVSPRRFVPDYQVRVSRRDIAPLELDELAKAYVLSLVSRDENQLTMNLKAPLIINLEHHLGRQVVTNDEQPLQLDLSPVAQPYRKIA